MGTVFEQGSVGHITHPPKIKLSISAEKVTDRSSVTQPTNLAWEVLHPDYIVAFTASSSQTCFGVSERVSWLASLPSPSVSLQVLCDTWRYSRIISTICERATMKHSQVSSWYSNQLICHDNKDQSSYIRVFHG